jgi:phosphoketolase
VTLLAATSSVDDTDVDRLFRAANCLAVARLRLLANALLRKQLCATIVQLSQIRDRKRREG